MPGFYYYLPNLSQRELIEGNKFCHELLAERGLGEVIRDVEIWPRDMTVADVLRNGPDGGNGCILYPSPRDGKGDEPLDYRPEVQVWLEVDEHRWIGWLMDSPPAPAALLRSGELVAGYPVRDAHDRYWEVPVARQVDGGCGTLPQYFTYDAAGGSTGHVLDEHSWLWDLAGEIWDCFNYRNWKRLKDAADADPSSDRPDDLPDEDPPPGDRHDEQWLRAQVLRILGVNYRMGFAEANALVSAGLHLLDQPRIHGIAAVLIDLDIVVEVKKKAMPETSQPVPDSSAVTPGDGEGSQATVPATAS